MDQLTCLVTDVQRYSVNDGPGFRTNVYLKGCPLKCTWCHNPETISPEAELYWKRRSCVQCGACLDVCDQDAIFPPIPPEAAQQEGSTYQKVNRERCNQCFKCMEACAYGALEISGIPMTVETILEEVEADRVFYDTSGGGMTLSGGEPTSHKVFSLALLTEAKNRGLHTCLDTNGFCDWDTLAALLPVVDVVLFDLKHMDPERHKAETGVDNKRILENLNRLAAAGQEFWVRIPVVPGFNDDPEFHKTAARFLADLPHHPARIDLLPFHNWCENKYDWLGRDWALKSTEAMQPFFLELPAEVYRNQGLTVTIGGSGFEETGHGPESTQ
jgi:pyruvate formate lyase activating enzyme